MLKSCDRKSLYNRRIQFPRQGKFIFWPPCVYVCEIFLVRGTMPANQESVVERKLTQKLQLPTFRLPSFSKASPPSLRVAKRSSFARSLFTVLCRYLLHCFTF